MHRDQEMYLFLKMYNLCRYVRFLQAQSPIKVVLGCSVANYWGGMAAIFQCLCERLLRAFLSNSKYVCMRWAHTIASFINSPNPV